MCLYGAWIARYNPVRPGRGIQESLENTLRSYEYKIDILSRPRHPQSQGKVERCHGTLRSKMEYDLQKMAQDGVN